MRKPLRIAAMLSLVAALGAFAWFVFAAVVEPSYKGKRLSEWLCDYDKEFQSPAEANQAVREMGTRAIPFLLRMLDAREPSANQARLLNLLRRYKVLHKRRASAEVINHRAACGMAVLGASASNAVPRLIRIYGGHSNLWSKTYVVYALGSIGPPARDAVPLILSHSTNSDLAVQIIAIRALGKIHAQPGSCVPVLEKLVQDPEATIRFEAAGALANFGPDAKAAVPVLTNLLKNARWDPELREALKKIDPEVAGRLQIK